MFAKKNNNCIAQMFKKKKNCSPCFSKIWTDIFVDHFLNIYIISGNQMYLETRYLMDWHIHGFTLFMGFVDTEKNID